MTKKTLNEDIVVPIELTEGMFRVVAGGARKHGANSWLQPGVFDYNKRGQSMLRHLLKAYGLFHTEQDLNVLSTSDFYTRRAMDILLKEIGEAKFLDSNQLDDESGLSHFAHLQCNAGMAYTCIEKNLWKEKQ